MHHPNQVRPAVPENEKYWQVFDGDKQIEDFLQFRHELEPPSPDSDYENDCPIEENPLDEEVKSLEIADINLLSNKIEHATKISADLEKEDLEMLQSNTQSLLKGLVPLEELFDFNDVAKKPKLEPIETEVEECNIGSE